MDQKLIQRINELARKAKTVGLSPAEVTERDELRQRYITSFRAAFRQQLDSIKYTDEENSKPH